MANIKFSAFTQKVALGDVDFLVGYTGADNVRVAPSVFSGVYLPLAGGTMTGVVGVVAPDNFKWNFGTGSDLQIFHNATDSIVYNGTGALMLRGDDVRIQVADASQTSAIFAGGEVGIGVTPATLLDIGGMADPIVRIKSDVGGDPQLRFDGSAANRSGLIKFYDNGSNAGGFIDYHHNGDKMNFGAGSGSTVTMTVIEGAVGIGTDAPGYTLEVDGTQTSAIAPSYIVANESSGTFKMAIGVQNSPGVAQECFVGTLGNTDFKIMANSAFVGRITTTGKLMVGSADVPAAILELTGSGDAIRVESTNTGAAGAQMDLLHFTTSPADDDIHGLINFGGYYTGTTSAYGTQIKSVWSDVSDRDAELQFWTNKAGVLTKALTLNTDQNATFAGNIELGDGQQLQCGPLSGGDLKFYWDTDAGNIINKTGHLNIYNQSDDKSIYLQTDDGAGGTTTYIKIDGLQEFTEFPKNVRFMDNVYVQFGSSNDGHIVHNGTDMTIQNGYDDGDMNFKSDDGSGGVTNYFWLDGGIVKTRVAKDMNFEDNVKASFGNVVTPDLEIYHDTGNSYIVDTGTGSLKVGAANWHLMDSALAAYMMTATPGAEVNLYFNGSGRFVTTSDGVKVTGQYNVAALNTAPASAGAAGTLGEIRYTADYIYVCTATNTWKRTAISTW